MLQLASAVASSAPVTHEFEDEIKLEVTRTIEERPPAALAGVKAEVERAAPPAPAPAPSTAPPSTSPSVMMPLASPSAAATLTDAGRTPVEAAPAPEELTSGEVVALQRHESERSQLREVSDLKRQTRDQQLSLG